MGKPMCISDFEREVLVILLKQACESGNDAKAAVEEAITAYRSLFEQLQALKGEMRIYSNVPTSCQ
jgi:hypothetical protein